MNRNEETHSQVMALIRGLMTEEEFKTAVQVDDFAPEDMILLLENFPAMTDWIDVRSIPCTYWIDAIINNPALAKLYPLEEMNDKEEIKRLLRHRPELVKRIKFQQDDPPVKVHLATAKEKLRDQDGDETEHMSRILEDVFAFDRDDALDFAISLHWQKETFTGIYPKETARKIYLDFATLNRVHHCGYELRFEAC